MRYVILSCLSALLMSACASIPMSEASLPNERVSDLAATPGATPGMIAADQASHTYAAEQAQLRDIRNAEARVSLARARLDLATVRNKGADDGDVREFLNARQSLRRLRTVYGPTDTGYRDQFYVPVFPYGRHWPRRGKRHSTEPVGIAGSAGPNIGNAKPLSGLIR